jgi:hypothetical protein
VAVAWSDRCEAMSFILKSVAAGALVGLVIAFFVATRFRQMLDESSI